MAKGRKSWQEKLNNGREAIVEQLDKPYAGMAIGAKMLIPTPLLVDAYVKHIPKGVSVSLQQMRIDLAADYHADFTCPLTSGIFIRIVAEAAYEEFSNGKPLTAITPFWRIINAKAPVAKKLSFGFDFVKEQRQREGLKI
jgi:hypothetical protein